MEIENHASDTALLDLVDGLNTIAGSGVYSAVVIGPVGSDAIKVAFIYQPGQVSPVGNYQILDSSVDSDFISTKNRPSLAQTFQETANGEKLTIVVNHFKSKGSACDDVGDPDLNDGQGNCSQTRAKAAQALVDWLKTDPTGSRDPDFLIIGDLNSYAKEDAIGVVEDGGYTNLVLAHGGDYGYVFDGQWGTLDYSLANNSLVGQTTGAAEWHINADEPVALDYNEDYKSTEQKVSLYGSGPYRASDHDPVVVGLDLRGQGQPRRFVYLPIIVKPFDPNTYVNPPLAGSPMLPVKGVTASSESFTSYANAMAGSDNVSGGDILLHWPQSQWGDLTYSLVQCNFLNTYTIRRAYFEFDTSTVPDTFVSAQLVFTNSTPWAGPPVHNIAVHKGNWTTLIEAGNQFPSDNWTAYQSSPLSTVPGGILGNPTGFQQIVVDLPRSAINFGGTTKLMLRSTTEGTPAVGNSC